MVEGTQGNLQQRTDRKTGHCGACVLSDGMTLWYWTVERDTESYLKEALHICTTAKGKNFNRDQGVELYDYWLTAVTRYESHSRTGYRHRQVGHQST